MYILKELSLNAYLKIKINKQKSQTYWFLASVWVLQKNNNNNITFKSKFKTTKKKTAENQKHSFLDNLLIVNPKFTKIIIQQLLGCIIFH